MEAKSDGVYLGMAAPEAERVPELAALPMAGRPTRDAQGCCGDRAKPRWTVLNPGLEMTVAASLVCCYPVSGGEPHVEVRIGCSILGKHF